jgi:hypothetical protein
MSWFDLLIILLLSAHLFAMNVATAGPFVCLWLGRRARRNDDPLARDAGRWLALQSVMGLTGGIVLGGLVLVAIWFHRPDPFFRPAELIPRSRYWFGIGELAFSYVLLMIYLATWNRSAGRWWHASLAFLAATNTIYHFPPLFSAIGVLSTRPEMWNRPELDRSAFLALLRDPETLSRTAHFILASFAVTGVMLLARASRLAKQPETEADAARMTIWGGWLALVPTVIQLLSGLWLLFSSPAPLQTALTGGELGTTMLFGISLLAAFGLLPALASAAFGAAGRKERFRAMVFLAVTILSMVAARHLAHQKMFDGYTAKPAQNAAR